MRTAELKYSDRDWPVSLRADPDELVSICDQPPDANIFLRRDRIARHRRNRMQRTPFLSIRPAALKKGERSLLP